MVAAVAIQKYKRTTDPKRMMVHALLSEAIRKDWDAIKGFLPARTATYTRYDNGATKAVAWDEGGKETKIDLPLNHGWYVPDGNPFAIPNGKESNREDPVALYLYRYQDRSFNGPLGCGDYWSVGGGRRFVAGGDWSDVAGVALVGREATAPLVRVPREALVTVSDPKALLQRAEQLEGAAKELTERLGGVLNPEDYARLIKPTADEAAFLRELAGKIQKNE